MFSTRPCAKSKLVHFLLTMEIGIFEKYFFEGHRQWTLLKIFGVFSHLLASTGFLFPSKEKYLTLLLSCGTMSAHARRGALLFAPWNTMERPSAEKKKILHIRI